MDKRSLRSWCPPSHWSLRHLRHLPCSHRRLPRSRRQRPNPMYRSQQARVGGTRPGDWQLDFSCVSPRKLTALVDSSPMTPSQGSGEWPVPLRSVATVGDLATNWAEQHITQTPAYHVSAPAPFAQLGLTTTLGACLARMTRTAGTTSPPTAKCGTSLFTATSLGETPLVRTASFACSRVITPIACGSILVVMHHVEF